MLVQGYGSDPLLARSVCELGLIPGELLGTIPPGTRFPLTDETVCVIGVAQSLLYPRVRVDMLIVLGFYITRTGVPAIFMLGYWFLLQLLGGASALGREGGGVAFWAHVGGFAAGALLVLLFRNPRLVARHPYYGWRPRGARGGRSLR